MLLVVHIPFVTVNDFVPLYHFLFFVLGEDIVVKLQATLSCFVSWKVCAYHDERGKWNEDTTIFITIYHRRHSAYVLLYHTVCCRGSAFTIPLTPSV